MKTLQSITILKSNLNSIYNYEVIERHICLKKRVDEEFSIGEFKNRKDAYDFAKKQRYLQNL